MKDERKQARDEYRGRDLMRACLRFQFAMAGARMITGFVGLFLSIIGLLILVLITATIFGIDLGEMVKAAGGEISEIAEIIGDMMES